MADTFLQGLAPVDETGVASTQLPGTAPDSFLRGAMPIAETGTQYRPDTLSPVANYDSLDAIAHGVSLGLTDPLHALNTAGMRYLSGDTPNFDYPAAAREIEAGRRSYAANSPWGSALSNLAGNMAFPGALTARGVNAVASPIAKIAMSTLLGGTMGGVQGAADNATSVERAVEGAKTGAATGALVGEAIPTAATLIPGLTPAAQTLRSAGIEPLPGAARGGILETAEDLLSKVPIIGLPIQAGRRGAQEQLAEVVARNREAFPGSAVNHALTPIGESLAPDTAVGNAQIAEMMKKASGAYEAAVPAAGAPIDATASTALADARSELALSAPDRLAQFDAFVAAKVHNKVESGILPGDAFKRAESDLGKQYSRLATGDSDQQALGDSYREVQHILRENLARNASDPNVAADIAAANETWKRALAVRHAAGGDLASGTFTPTQLASSARTVAGRNRYGEGRAPMQGFAQDAMASDLALSNAARTLAPLREGGMGQAVGSGLFGAGLAEHLWQNPSVGRAAAFAVPYGLLSAAYSNAGRGAVNQAIQGTRGLLDTATPYAPAAGGFASGLLNLAGG